MTTELTAREQVEIDYHAAVLQALMRYALDGHPLSFETRLRAGPSPAEGRISGND